MKTIFVFGNGNLSFDDFIACYLEPLKPILENEDPAFVLCDFRGVDSLMMEFLKCRTSKVSVYHMGGSPRYFPDKFKTSAGRWQLKGGFSSDAERDEAAMNACTHFLACDFNSDGKRKSGTLKNIEACIKKGKIDL